MFDKQKAFWEETIPALVNPVIKTNSGKVKGETIQYPISAVVHFRGIPYAKPPVNNLRFEKSEAIDGWNGTLDATQYRSACMQRDSEWLAGRTMSEDCLFLNIFVPGRPVMSTKKAVMVWIHDNQHFTSGKGDTFDGSLLALKGDVIVVNFNYRLSIFGFLTENGTALKGNYGLWDQRLALQWIKNNIGHFGGNSSAITIFGDGDSVTLQSLSPLNKGLFQRAIAQGGNVLSPFAISKVRTDYSDFYASFGCTTEKNKNISDCLKSQPATDFFKFEFPTKKSHRFNLPFIPTMDGEFIPADPLTLISDMSSENAVDMMVGLNDGEGSRFLPFLRSIYNASITHGVSRDFVCGTWIQAIATTFGFDDESIPSRVCQIYEMGEHGNGTYAQQALAMLTDAFLSSSMIQFLQLISEKNSKTFQYLFSRENKYLNYNRLPQWFKGSQHRAEIGFLFNIPSLSSDSADSELSNKIIDYWTNFAKHG